MLPCPRGARHGSTLGLFTQAKVERPTTTLAFRVPVPGAGTDAAWGPAGSAPCRGLKASRQARCLDDTGSLGWSRNRAGLGRAAPNLLLPAGRQPLNTASARRAPPSRAEPQRDGSSVPAVPLAPIDTPRHSKSLLTSVNRLLKMIIAG